jgi:LPS sulfotransferase NodH
MNVVGQIQYCIAFSTRTGSTLMCQDLDSIGMNQQVELFQEPSYPEDADGAMEYLRSRVAVDPESFGFKVSWEQARELCDRLRPGRQSSDPDLHEYFPNMRWILLSRRDKVLQAVSNWRATKTGLWHEPAGHGDKGQVAGELHIEFDPREASKFFMQMAAEELLWRDYFSRLGVDHLEVVYEDYVGNRLAGLQRICDFLGVDRPREAPVEGLRRLADDWSEEAKEQLWAYLKRNWPGAARVAV